jgi:hypothetical protein
MAEATSWTPAFPGQRAPFEPGNPHRAGEGNALAVTHGATSPRRVAPLAAEIEKSSRNSPAWPGYLSDQSYAPAVSAWAWAEAVCALLRDFIADRDLDEAMTDHMEETSTETHGKGRSTRTTSGRRTRNALGLLDQWEARAAGHRARLGLDPLSRARLGRDVTAAGTDLVALLTAARERHERGES